MRQVHPLASWLVILLIILFALFFSALAVQQHRTFQTNGLDLGNVDQALWNTAQGRFLHFTLMTPVQSRLALHVEPILLAFVPLYWLKLGSPELLLIVQATVVAIGAWPVYQIALHQFQRSQSARSNISAFRLPPSALVVLPLVYLLLPTLESAVLYDFHAVTLASTFLLFAFWALVQQKDGWFIVFGLLAMACKEDMPLVVAMLGLYAGLARRRWRLAGLVIGLSAVWFSVAFFLIQPRFAAGGNIQLDRYAWLGSSPLEMLKTALTNPALVFNHLWYQADLLAYLTDLLFPTAFLALFSPLTLLPMLPTLAINLLSDNPFTWRLEDFHYGAPLAPFLIISTIYGLKRLTTWLPQTTEPPSTQPSNLRPIPTTQSPNHQTTPPAPHPTTEPPNHPTTQPSILFISLTLLLLLFTAVYHYYRGYTPLARPFRWPQVTAHHRLLSDLLPTIPAGAPLFTQSNLAPHLSQRPTIYSDFAYFTDPAFPAWPVEDILLDVTSFENSGGLHQYLRHTLVASGAYQLVTARDGILHLRPLTAGRQLPESPAPAQIPDSFYTFAEPDSSPAYDLTVDFGDLVRLRGYSLHFNRQEEVQVSVDLEPRQPLPADFQPVLYLLDGAGQPEGATVDLQPTLVWYPPEQWRTGETVRVRFNTLPWYTRGTPAYRLALGVIAGADPWNVGLRKRPVVRESDRAAPRLPADGSLLELARIEQVWAMPAGGPAERRFTAPAPPYPLAANFDNQLRLLGHGEIKVESTPASSLPDLRLLTIPLYWQAIAPPEPLVRFVQLVGPDGLIYGQNDSGPDGGQYPTQLWLPGEVVLETVSLPVPADLPSAPGRYFLHVGLYRPDTGVRLPLSSGDDHVKIAVPFFNEP